LIKAVLFDNDGVLINSMPYHFKAWKTVFAEYDIYIKRDDVLLTEGCKSIELAQKIFSDKEIKLSDEELTRFVKRKNELYQSITEATLRPGTESFLRQLKEDHLLIGLVTGTSRGNVDKVFHPDVLALFDCVITGDDVSKGKPDPEAYLKAANELNVKSSECLVIENAPLGIEAANRADMGVVALTTTLKKEQLPGADLYAKDMQNLEFIWHEILIKMTKSNPKKEKAHAKPQRR